MIKKYPTTKEQPTSAKLGIDFARHITALKKENKKDMDELKQELLEQVHEAIESLQSTAQEIIEAVKSAEFIKGDKGDAGNQVDVPALEKSILSKVPRIDEESLISRAVDRVPKVDADALERRILKKVPKRDLKVLTQKVETDPMAIIEKIMAMPDFKIKAEQIDGLNQTFSAFHNQLGRGYMHGGGDTVIAGTNVTITTNASGQKVINATGGGGGAVDSVFGRTGIVTAQSGDYTTAIVADSSNKRYVTDAQLVVIGNTSGINTGDQTSVSGNAGTATALQNTRTIWGQNFNGTANVTGTLALGTADLTLTGSIGSTGARSLKGWFVDLQVTNAIAGSVTGNAATATALQNARTINAVSFDGTANIVVTAAAGTLTGATLNATVTASSLTSLGTITSLVATSADINGGTIDGTAIGGSSASTATVTTLTVNTNANPDANDGAGLGTGALGWSDLFLASGAVLNWNNGNATITHSAGLLTSNVDVAVPDEAYGVAWNGSLEAPTKNAIYDSQFYSSNYTRGLTALGSSILFRTMGNEQIGNSLTLTDGVARYVPVYIDRSVTITGVMWYQNTQGDYTADQNNYIGLYSFSAGTLTEVAITANDGNLWKDASGTFPTKDFSTPYSATPGIYYIGMLYNNSAQVTGPAIGQVQSLFSANSSSMGLPNSTKLYGTISAQNSLATPQAMSGITAGANAIWFALY